MTNETKKRMTVGGVTLEVSESALGPDCRFVLVTGKLSLARKAKLAKRVAAGESEARALAELLVEEGKAVVG